MIEVYNQRVRNLISAGIVAVTAGVVAVTAGCAGAAAPPPPPQPPPPEPQVTVPATPAEPPPLPARTDFAVGESPMSVVVAGDTLVWTDGAGAIWTMPSAGGQPAQLTEQHSHGFMFHPVVAGGDAFVSTKRDFVRVTLPRGPVTKLGLALAEDPEEVVADAQSIYVTLFKRDSVMAIPASGGAAKQVMTFRRGVLAQHGATLYAISYATGALVGVPVTGGKPKQIARGFVRPTALAVDDAAAFVYTEKDKTLRRVELATGAASVLAKDLENSDDLVSDGVWLYTFSWPNQLLRIAKDGSRRDVLADDLASPYHIAVDERAIYVVSRDQGKIIRFAKRP